MVMKQSLKLLIKMQFEYSEHWIKKKKYRNDITEYMLEYVITNSAILRDKHWDDALNAICRVHPSGRILKVVYKIKSKDLYKIITAYWLD